MIKNVISLNQHFVELLHLYDFKQTSYQSSSHKLFNL